MTTKLSAEPNQIKVGDRVLYEGQKRIVAEVVLGKIGGPHYRLRGCPFLVGHDVIRSTED